MPKCRSVIFFPAGDLPAGKKMTLQHFGRLKLGWHTFLDTRGSSYLIPDYSYTSQPQHPTSWLTASCTTAYHTTAFRISHIPQPQHPASATVSQPQHQHLMYTIQTGSWYLLLQLCSRMHVCVLM